MCIILSSVNSWGSGCERTTDIFPRMLEAQDDSRVIMTSRQEAHGPWKLHAYHWSRRHHKDLLVSLSLPRQMSLQRSMSTTPGWAGHGIQLGLELEDLLSALPRLFFNFLQSSHQYFDSCTEDLMSSVEKVVPLPSNLHPSSLRGCHLLCVSEQIWESLEEAHSLVISSLIYPVSSDDIRNIQALEASSKA